MLGKSVYTCCGVVGAHHLQNPALTTAKFIYRCGSVEGWGIRSMHPRNSRKDITDSSWYRSHAIQITMAPCFSPLLARKSTNFATQITNPHRFIRNHDMTMNTSRLREF